MAIWVHENEWLKMKINLRESTISFVPQQNNFYNIAVNNSK